jgi:hypothetical protein
VFRPRGFTPPRRLAPPWRRACVATRFRPWGSSRFHPLGFRPCALANAWPSASGDSPGCVPALRSLPSVHSDRDETRDCSCMPSTVGSRHQPRGHPRRCTPTTFPARPCVAANEVKLPSHRWSSRGTSRSCSVPGPVADHLVAEVACSLLPWAWIHVPPARPEGSACESCFWYVKERP